ncbi:MAG: hypothetical protein NTU41_14910, partial [Chloroflexi bacterium]|nr:hypothetical protein [Chloroflexota bacterium]
KMTVSRLAQLGNLSQHCVSQVKSGKRPPSEKLLQPLEEHRSRASNGLTYQKPIALFIGSRRDGISPNTVRDYRITLSKAVPALGLRSPTAAEANSFLHALSCSPGGRFGYFKCLRASFNWLYSPKSGLGFKPEDNPVT